MKSKETIANKKKRFYGSNWLVRYHISKYLTQAEMAQRIGKTRISFCSSDIESCICFRSSGSHSFFYRQSLLLQPAPWLASQATALNLPILTTIRWLDLFLLIFKPASLAIVNLSIRFQPPQLPQQSDRDFNPEKKETHIVSEDSLQSNNVYGAGEMIGFLERFLMVIFLSLGQYASIGLIMTAKSIARYDKITKNGAFAEDYLIGTLASIIIAISGYLVVFGV